MNVASLELSKELYELSGWDDSGIVICQSGSYREEYGPESDKGWFGYTEQEAVHHHGGIYPTYRAYDLGYLLRKLPQRSVEGRLGMDSEGIALGKPTFYYANATGTYYTYGQADTYEDAAAKLAIELFKQGVLTRGGDE